MPDYIVVVERGKSSLSVGPYRQFARADGDAKLWDGTDDRKAWVEVCIPHEVYVKQHAFEMEQERHD